MYATIFEYENGVYKYTGLDFLSLPGVGCVVQMDYGNFWRCLFQAKQYCSVQWIVKNDCREYIRQ